MDETYVKVCKVWYFLFRAVDKDGLTSDFNFSQKKNKNSAYKFFKKDVTNNGIPEKINIDKGGANTARIKYYNQRHGTNIEIRQCKYLNNIIEQSHQKIKRQTINLITLKSIILRFVRESRKLSHVKVAAKLNVKSIEIDHFENSRKFYTSEDIITFLECYELSRKDF